MIRRPQTGERALTPSEWRPLALAHAGRARALTAAHVARRDRGEKHPLEDFLFEYYGFRPGQLARWHPGPGIGLVDADLAGARFYRTDGNVTTLDVEAFRTARGRGIDWVRQVLEGTASREPDYTCFCLHEWAMVYGLKPEEVRHHALGLRASADEVAKVVESHEIRCSHYDAFRFFTADARPLNTVQPLVETQPEHEQPGCLHGGTMDLYRWAYKLSPAIPSELLLDAFELAREARVLDMRSSPYDVRPFGLTNILIETAAGKAEHVALQRGITERAKPLRERFLAILRLL